MIPRVDPQVKYVGTTYLRSLNSDKLRELSGAVVVQAENSDPLVVILPYETYLKMQEAANAAVGLPDGADWREFLSSSGKTTAETRGIRQKGDGKR